MGFAEAAQKANEAWAAKLGISAVYVLASGASSFACTIIPSGLVEIDDMGSGFVRDVTRYYILASELAANSITEPTPQMERQPGDQITISGPAGDENWLVIGSNRSQGMFRLTLERNIRPVPR
ncbi:MAG: hypothetical protein V2B18_21245 [Pseudomonadota bacterium]